MPDNDTNQVDELDPKLFPNVCAYMLDDHYQPLPTEFDKLRAIDNLLEQLERSLTKLHRLLPTISVDRVTGAILDNSADLAADDFHLLD